MTTCRAPVLLLILAMLAQAPSLADAHGPSLHRPLPPDGVFWTAKDLLGDFFSSSEKVSYQRFQLSPRDRSRVQKATGVEASDKPQVVYVARTGERVDGYAFLSEPDVLGSTAAFGVKLGASGRVERVEVMRLSDPEEQEVLNSRFLRQFQGRSVADASQLRRKIDKPQRCTSACRAATLTVARALILMSTLQNPQAK